MADHNVNIKLSAEDGASGVFAKVARRAREMNMEARTSGESAMSRMMTSQRGMSEGLFQMMGLGVGGAIFNAGLEATTKITEEAVRLRQEFDEGKISAGQFAAELAKSIPVLGQGMTIGGSIMEFIFGWHAAQARVNEEIKRSVEMYKLEAEGAKDLLKLTMDLATVQEHARVEMQNLTANPHQAAINNTEQSEKERTDSYGERMNAAMAKAREDADKEMAIARQNVAAAHVKDKTVRGGNAAGIAAAEAVLQQKNFDALHAEEVAQHAFVATEEQRRKTAAAKIVSETMKLNSEKAELARQGAQEINRVNVEAQAARLKSMGREFEAEKLLQQNQHAGKESDIVAAGMKGAIGAMSDPGEMMRIAKETMNKLGAESNRFAAEQAGAKINEDAKTLKANQDADAALIDAKGKTQDEITRLAGAASNSRIVQLKAETDAHIAELKRQAEAQKKKNDEDAKALAKKDSAHAGAIMAKAASVDAGIDAMLAGNMFDAGKPLRDAQAERNGRLLGAMPPELSLGGRGTGAAARQREESSTSIMTQILQSQKETAAAAQAALQALWAIAKQLGLPSRGLNLPQKGF